MHIPDSPQHIRSGYQPCEDITDAMHEYCVSQHTYQRNSVSHNDERTCPVLQSQQTNTKTDTEKKTRDQHPDECAFRVMGRKHLAHTESKPSDDVEGRNDCNTYRSVQRTIMKSGVTAV